MVERNTGRVGALPTKIASLATYVPPKVLSNADLEKMVETSDDWIMQRVGIRERHIVDAGVATSDLGKEAALAAIERAGLTPDDITLIVVRRVLRRTGQGLEAWSPRPSHRSPRTCFAFARPASRTAIGTRATSRRRFCSGRPGGPLSSGCFEQCATHWTLTLRPGLF